MDSLYDYSSWMEGIDLPNLSVIEDLCGLQLEAGPPAMLKETELQDQLFLFSDQQDIMMQPDWGTILPGPSPLRDIGDTPLWPANHFRDGDWDRLPVCSSPPAAPEPGALAVSTVPSPPLPCPSSDESLLHSTPQNHLFDEYRSPSADGPVRQGRRGRKPKRKPYARESRSAGPSPPAMSASSSSSCTASPSPMTPTLRLTSSRARNAQHEISPGDIDRIVREATSPVAACPFCDKRVSHGGLQRHLRTHAAVEEYCVGVPVALGPSDGVDRQPYVHPATGEVMVGGCGAGFSRHDAYLRHLTKGTCLPRVDV
ncbi:hypothetical protein DAEQUDRAFT_721601 [Daedalea quercina L-15889]|uniref:C2H2-type domain-containing protein n=1 Tax=Daedalea quercina L-15889 TaxID=1314783 RepID=A0A165TJP9_9APHY|nr:hypothetical protein DAEQUDRAFT_721601 [Daedalea quercina L-15889]